MTDLPRQETDVVVIGSGAAGLVAALTAAVEGADVVLLEKTDKIGGTTAVSAGGVWIPDHPHLSGDSREAARTYLSHLAGPDRDEALLDAYLDAGPDMVRFVESRSPVRFQTIERLPDYFSNDDGACPGGRTLDPGVYDTRRLGEWSERLRSSPVFGPLPLSLRETLDWRITSHPQAIPLDLVEERLRDGVVSYGAALVGQLLEALLEHEIEPRLESSARSLLTEAGAVVGVEVEGPDGTYPLGARLGVVLACGGFEWSEELMDRFLNESVRPLSPPGNTGDGLRMAMLIGADLASLDQAWWCPAMRMPDESYEGETFFRGDFTHRALPHSLVVNRHGKRFANEANNYHDFTKSFFAVDSNGQPQNQPAWLIVDGQYLESYALFDRPAGSPPPDWLEADETIEGLAASLGISPTGLRDTISRFNEFAECGVDWDFRRGESLFDRLYGDPDNRPHPCLGKLEKPPFVAVPLQPGTLGTKGGLRVDVRGRVQHADGGAIPGLFAAGNVMASCTGAGYPGGGTPIGTGMTFGYLAGRTAVADRRTSGRLSA